MTAADPNDTTLADRALDLFVYAPVGLALEARELIPKLAERGRGQVAIARLIGGFAVQRGRREAEQFLSRTPGASDSEPGPPSEPPIVAYDNLRATEILPLLDDLDADALDAVEAHELANRGRRTVLGRVEQLRN